MWVGPSANTATTARVSAISGRSPRSASMPRSGPRRLTVTWSSSRYSRTHRREEIDEPEVTLERSRAETGNRDPSSGDGDRREEVRSGRGIRLHRVRRGAVSAGRGPQPGDRGAEHAHDVGREIEIRTADQRAGWLHL